MFDTIHFPKEIKCKVCGESHHSTQTKQFESLLLNYHVGDIMPGSLITGIIEESIFCEHKSLKEKRELSSDQKVYLVIWHRILVNIVEEIDTGETLLNKFGLADLYFLYEKLFQEKNDFETKYKKLKTYAKIIFKYLCLSPKEQESFKKGENLPFTSFPELEVIKVLNDKDPLNSLIEKLDGQKFKEKIFF